MPIHVPQSALDYAELAIHVVGVGLLLTAAAALTWRRRWRESLRLPPPPTEAFQPLDVLIAVWAAFLLGPMVRTLLAATEGAPAATQPASDPAPVSSGLDVVAATIARLLAAAVMLSIARIRFGGLVNWGLDGRRLPRQLAAAALAYLATWPICSGSYVLTMAVLERFFPDFVIPEHTAILTLRGDGVPAWIAALTVINALLLAPIVEEFLFRGVLQPAAAAWSRSTWLAIAACGAAFGLIHYPQVQNIPALAAFGVVLGWTYARTRSLTLVILLHAILNGKTLLWVALA